MRQLAKIALLPIVWWACAIGGAYWMVYGFWFGNDAQDRARASDFFGVAGSAMQPQWDRLYSDWSIYENLKNIGSEWTRLDPQRAIKLVCLGWLVSVLALGGVGCAILW